VDLDWALTTGDPLADAVVAEMAADRAVRAMLADGITNGLDSLPNPTPGIKALLAQAETVPDYVDDDLLDRGSLPHFVPHPVVHQLSLSAGALVRVYDSPSIATVLARTGRLIDGVAKRLEETGKWVSVALLPGAMRVGAPGYVATMQVRLLHARVRSHLSDGSYVPLNQLELARTWMDFTVTSYVAEERIGFGKTLAEQQSLYRYWRNIGHVLGVDPRLIEGVTSNETALRINARLQARTGPPSAESGRLAEASLRYVADTLHEFLNVPKFVGVSAMYALTRRFHGNAMCDDLGLPKARIAQRILAAGVLYTRFRHWRVRRDPAKRLSAQERGIAAAVAAAENEDPTAYAKETQ
jgi:hypothetical protein